MARSRFPNRGRQKPSGSIILDPQLLGRRKLADWKLRDPKLKTRPTVPVVRCDKQEEAHFSGGNQRKNSRGGNQRKDSTGENQRKGSKAGPKLSLRSNSISQVKSTSPGRTRNSLTPAASAAQPKIIIQKKPVVKATKSNVIKGKIGRGRPKTIQPAAKPARKKSLKASSPKKLRLSFSAGTFLLTLVKQFQINLDRKDCAAFQAPTLETESVRSDSPLQHDCDPVEPVQDKKAEEMELDPVPVPSSDPHQPPPPPSLFDNILSQTKQTFMGETKRKSVELETQMEVEEEEDANEFRSAETQVIKLNDRRVSDSDEQDDSLAEPEDVEADDHVVLRMASDVEASKMVAIESERSLNSGDVAISDASAIDEAEAEATPEHNEAAEAAPESDQRSEAGDIADADEVLEEVEVNGGAELEDSVDTTTADDDLIPEWDMEDGLANDEYSGDDEEDEDVVVTNGGGFGLPNISGEPDSSTRCDPVPFIDFGKQIRNALSAKQSASK